MDSNIVVAMSYGRITSAPGVWDSNSSYVLGTSYQTVTKLGERQEPPPSNIIKYLKIQDGRQVSQKIFLSMKSTNMSFLLLP